MSHKNKIFLLSKEDTYLSNKAPGGLKNSKIKRNFL